jgi:polar amino acid transport system substrate-binding protein
MDGSLWRRGRLPLVLLTFSALAVAACTGGGSSPSAAAPSEPAASQPMASEPAASEPAASGDTEASPIPGGLLEKVLTAGTIVMSTDPEYPPQSSVKADGSYEGFDIDVGTEIAERLGVEITFETPSWDALTAGNWNGRWDFSVGSMTITTDREKVIAFTEPYYYTPAQMAVHANSTIASVAELAGQRVCVGSATTYQQWIEGTLDFGSKTPDAAPEGITVVSLPTDRNCAEAWQAGREDFEGWLSSSTTVQGAIDEGLPIKAVGDPVFAEPLAVAFDKSGLDPSDMVARVDAILAEMHSDGTLKTLSEKWFGEDLTTPAGE